MSSRLTVQSSEESKPKAVPCFPLFGEKVIKKSGNNLDQIEISLVPIGFVRSIFC
jgi:hypothetical protein